MKRKTILFILIGVIVIFMLILGVEKRNELTRYREIIQNMTIEDIDLAKINDGVYQGTSEAIWVAADVEVTVTDHKITKIELVRHLNGRGKPAEVIVEQVKQRQSLKVDTITGATSSSKVILKAIENALK